MIKEKAALISIVPWLLVCVGFAFFGPVGHPVGEMIFYAAVLFGYFYAVFILARKFSHWAFTVFSLGGVLLACLYGLFGWRAGFEVFYVTVMVMFALFSYSIFLYLVERPKELQ